MAGTPFSLQPSTNRDTGAIAASRRSAMMMTEDAKFATALHVPAPREQLDRLAIRELGTRLFALDRDVLDRRVSNDFRNSDDGGVQFFIGPVATRSHAIRSQRGWV